MCRLEKMYVGSSDCITRQKKILNKEPTSCENHSHSQAIFQNPSFPDAHSSTP